MKEVIIYTLQKQGKYIAIINVWQSTWYKFLYTRIFIIKHIHLFTNWALKTQISHTWQEWEN